MDSPHGRRSLAGYSPWGCRESDATEQLNTAVFSCRSSPPPRSSFRNEGALPQLLDKSPAYDQLPLSSGKATAGESSCLTIVLPRATRRGKGEVDSGDGLGSRPAAPAVAVRGWSEPQTLGSRRTAKTEAGDPRPTGLRPPHGRQGRPLLPQRHDSRGCGTCVGPWGGAGAGAP